MSSKHFFGYNGHNKYKWYNSYRDDINNKSCTVYKIEPHRHLRRHRQKLKSYTNLYAKPFMNYYGSHTKYSYLHNPYNETARWTDNNSSRLTIKSSNPMYKSPMENAKNFTTISINNSLNGYKTDGIIINDKCCKSHRNK